jgi:hypothetical protein
MRKDEDTKNEAQVVERTGLALVHEGERIFSAPAAQAVFLPAGANVVNYYFPVEIEILGADAGQALAESIYDALQREFSAMG